MRLEMSMQLLQAWVSCLTNAFIDRLGNGMFVIIENRVDQALQLIPCSHPSGAAKRVYSWLYQQAVRCVL